MPVIFTTFWTSHEFIGAKFRQLENAIVGSISGVFVNKGMLMDAGVLVYCNSKVGVGGVVFCEDNVAQDKTNNDNPNKKYPLLAWFVCLEIVDIFFLVFNRWNLFAFLT